MNDSPSNLDADSRADRLLAELHAQLSRRRRAALARSALLTLAALGLSAWLALGAGRPGASRTQRAEIAAASSGPMVRYHSNIQIVRDDPTILARWSVRPAGRVEAVGDPELRSLLARSGDGVVSIAGQTRLIAYAASTP